MSAEAQWPSVDDAVPDEQGGPTARIGFNYQDEVAVSVLLEMLADPLVIKVHCETHDDIAKIYHTDANGGALICAEYIQVKASEQDKLWSVADLCADSGQSIFEKSLRRDGCKEESRFRIVTLRPVTTALRPLTYPCNGPGREPTCAEIAALQTALDDRFPNIKSKKGNGSGYWLQHCHWEERHDEKSLKNQNILGIIALAKLAGVYLLPEQADIVADGLRKQAYDAGRAKWKPDKAKKIITRSALLNWWTLKLQEISDGVRSPSGGKLISKMEDASVPDEQIKLAVDLRRDYSRLIRTPRYMEDSKIEHLQGRVKSELMSLRSQLVAGTLDVNGLQFHALCIERMDQVNQNRPANSEDQSAFLKGCMYDVTDRCLHRFSRPDK